MNNSFNNDTIIIWKINIKTSHHFLPALEEILYAHGGDEFPTIADFEIAGDSEKRLLEGYYNVEPDIKELKEAIKIMADIFNIAAPEFKLEPLEDKDWISESQKILKPIDAGRFYLYGNHDASTVPDNKISIMMEAGQAFGTGSHETTKGCLLAISDIFEMIEPQTVLDLGCGSGVLAIAMAKQWNTKIIASDIDPIAIDTAKENISINGLSLNNPEDDTAGITIVTSDGFGSSIVEKPYDLIVANILAEPLLQLAPDIVANLKESGFIILSGLLKIQQIKIIENYQKRGMELWKSFPINEWQTLVMRKK